MDLSFTKEEMAFRDEVRAFFRDNVPPPTRQKLQEGRHLSKDEMVTWWRILNKKGWGVSHWPKEYGGTGWTSVQHYIFNEELQMAPAPAPLAFGVSMVGPVIYTFGNEAQKKHFLPRIANVDDWWCQGFSEPGSGSDLASLKTKAERKGDKYIVNGQKTWTTLAQHADWIFCLCRTDPAAKKQSGISFILIDMRSKGITVRPIQTIDGGREVNEVFFDDVEVPVENLVGEENKGWDSARNCPQCSPQLCTFAESSSVRSCGNCTRRRCRFCLTLFRPQLWHSRRPGHRIGALHLGAVLGQAPWQVQTSRPPIVRPGRGTLV